MFEDDDDFFGGFGKGNFGGNSHFTSFSSSSMGGSGTATSIQKSTVIM